MPNRIAVSDLARAAYCPRQLHYARRDEDREPPPAVREIRALAFEYPTLLTASDDELSTRPLAATPTTYRQNLRRLSERDEWDVLTEPLDREVLLTGKDCRGVAHKLVGDPVVPSVVSPGMPPERGVWEPQRVRAVALAKALAWEREREVPTAYVEYPAHGVVRTVRLTTRNKAAYRRALRIARELDFVPPRLRDSAKCDECAYREQCGVKTRTLRSLFRR
ncbi:MULTISPECIES: Dna2/Cas4 domain-containing protein [Haloferax]|uniref:Dna2/Cas4 domain-containing protein n=1 Tax=Haloferax marinum TaxID=2666143 RepID=A0A6A8G8S1_9EURY|nr:MULTISPECIES: Dna2/Cas4 domain-containing protein [Haloferax]KAB1197471.1 Dna2/Cas4 domain-containing protein [Haloferax sp. CBA1150]MRW96516.1 Dna2/Cas4 domain-containing protein [Haloferax marinum]